MGECQNRWTDACFPVDLPLPWRHAHPIATLQFTGYLLVQYPANYTFFLTSTNAARLVFVDSGEVAVENTATGSSTTESSKDWQTNDNLPSVVPGGTRTLNTGWHSIRWAGIKWWPGALCSHTERSLQHQLLQAAELPLAAPPPSQPPLSGLPAGWSTGKARFPAG